MFIITTAPYKERNKGYNVWSCNSLGIKKPIVPKRTTAPESMGINKRNQSTVVCGIKK